MSFTVTHSLSLDTDATRGQSTIITKPPPVLIKDEIPLRVPFYHPRALHPIPDDYVREGTMLPEMTCSKHGKPPPNLPIPSGGKLNR